MGMARLERKLSTFGVILEFLSIFPAVDGARLKMSAGTSANPFLSVETALDVPSLILAVSYILFIYRFLFHRLINFTHKIFSITFLIASVFLLLLLTSSSASQPQSIFPLNLPSAYHFLSKPLRTPSASY